MPSSDWSAELDRAKQVLALAEAEARKSLAQALKAWLSTHDCAIEVSESCYPVPILRTPYGTEEI